MRVCDETVFRTADIRPGPKNHQGASGRTPPRPPRTPATSCHRTTCRSFVVGAAASFLPLSFTGRSARSCRRTLGGTAKSPSATCGCRVPPLARSSPTVTHWNEPCSTSTSERSVWASCTTSCTRPYLHPNRASKRAWHRRRTNRSDPHCSERRLRHQASTARC